MLIPNIACDLAISFMIQVPHEPHIHVGNSEAAASTLEDVQTFGLPTGPTEDHFDPGPTHEGSDDGGGESPSGESPPDPHGHNIEAHGPLFNCHFYRLRHAPLHIFLNNAAGVPMLRELARHLGIVPASLLQAHPVQAQMVGDQIADFSFVLQSIMDLPAASSDALVILDVEVHFCSQPRWAPTAASCCRVVLFGVPLHVTREDVLGFAGRSTILSSSA